MKVNNSAFYKWLNETFNADCLMHKMVKGYLLSNRDNRLHSITVNKNLIITVDCDFEVTNYGGLIDIAIEYIFYLDINQQFHQVQLKFE